MFDIKDFIKLNLIDGVKNGAFAKEYANILAVNYMSKGIISTGDVEAISIGIDVVLEELQVTPVAQEPVTEEPIE